MLKIFTTIFTTGIFLSSAAAAYAHYDTEAHTHMTGITHSWGFGLDWIFIIIFWAFVISGVVTLVHWLSKQK